MSRSSSDRVELLIEALPFIQRFRGHLFVIKYGGAAMDDEHVVERFLRDVVFLEAVGINPVLIHGGGKAITARMREAGLKARFVNGLRVTDEQSIQIVEDVLDNDINPRSSPAERVWRKGGRHSWQNCPRREKLPPQTEGKETGSIWDSSVKWST
jgi:acetylglutamate kinase